MARLSNVTDVTRKILEIITVSVIAIVLLIVIFRVGMFLKDMFAPTPPPPPTVSFGKLNFLSFPQSVDFKTHSYSINTLSGTLPQLPDRISVYKLQLVVPNLLALDKAKGVAKAAKFLDSPTPLSDVSYKWIKNDPFPQTFTMNIQSLDFVLTSSYLTDKTVLGAAHVPDQNLAQTISHTFFDQVMPLPDSIDSSKTKATLFAINGSSLTPATSLSTTQIIRVDYFPKSIDTLPIYTANPTQSLIYALIASGETDYPQVVEAQYLHKAVSTDKTTYPIKTGDKAFTELKQGNGYIAANPTGTTSVSITNVSLGYYVDASPQGYLWPIIVFQGDNGFYAYVSALTDEWVQK